MIGDHPVVRMHAHRNDRAIADLAGPPFSFDEAYAAWRRYGNEVPQDYADHEAERRLAEDLGAAYRGSKKAGGARPSDNSLGERVLSYDIVTQEHGGTISVDSQIGEFTEFTVRLPRTSSATIAEAAS
jgi:hypothetical protein